MSNQTNILPKDITSEIYREYNLGNGRFYRIEDPQELYVGATTHRVVDKDGVAHCIPFPAAGNQVITLKWKNRDGKPRVNF